MKSDLVEFSPGSWRVANLKALARLATANRWRSDGSNLKCWSQYCDRFFRDDGRYYPLLVVVHSASPSARGYSIHRSRDVTIPGWTDNQKWTRGNFMSCCDDCNSGTNAKTSGAVVINFGDQDRVHPELVGSCFEATNFFFRDSRGVLTREDLFVRVTNLGKTFNVSIFEKALPFDVLVGTLQFNPVTGETSTKTYRQITWVDFEFHFDYVPIKTNNWKKIGPNMFRVRNHAGVIEVLEQYSAVRTDAGRRILEYVTQSSHESKWPIFLMEVGQRNFELRVADALDIHEWRNDAAWQ